MAKSKGVRLRMLAYLRFKISSQPAVLVITLGSTIAEIHTRVMACKCEWEDGFETDTGDDEEQQQNEEQRTPEKAPATSVMKISTENAATRTWGGKVLFRK